MPTSRSSSPVSLHSIKKTVEYVETAPVVEPTYLEGYPLLRDKSEEELAVLNKKVLRKLDWKFLPCITAMLLMKYVFLPSVRLSKPFADTTRS